MRRFSLHQRWTALGLAACALAVFGCANCRFPQIDPSGERIFAESPAGPEADFRPMPDPNKTPTRVGLSLCPRASVAPIGSEVVLIAGVKGPDQYLRTNERIEWMLDPASVGQFIDLDKGSWTDPLVGDFTSARKIDNTYAVNSTSRRLLRLTRGTTDPGDDVQVLRGQAWITVTSASEGTSHVTVLAPNVSPWTARTATAQIHWVDAQWCFPAPSIASAGGRQTLTTTVTRQSDKSPRSGWIVRYEVCDGPPAGFAPDGARAIEVATDPQGRASVELIQQQAQAGTNRVAIQVVRPAGLGCPNERLVVGSTCVLQTWSSPDLKVRVIGPASGSVGAAMSFRIEVSNPGDLAADEISLSAQVPAGLALVNASPASETSGASLRWAIGRLAAGEVRSIAVDLRAEQVGRHEFCAEAAGAGGLKARACATASVETAEIALEVLGPTAATVGDTVTHQIVVTNRSGVPATGLIIKDRRDRGLEHEVQQLEIERLLGDLGAGQSRAVRIVLRVAEGGSLCHTVEVTGPGGIRASRKTCIEAKAAPAGRPQAPTVPETPPPTRPDWIRPEQPAPPTTQPAPPITQPAPPVEPAPGMAIPAGPRFEVTAKVCDPNEVNISGAKVGDSVLLMVDVASPDSQQLSDLNVVIDIGEAFAPQSATADHVRKGSTFSWSGQTVPSRVIGRYALLCVCKVESASACFSATVSDLSGRQVADKACIPIAAAVKESAAGLDVKIGAMSSPATQGETFSYRVAIRNLGNADDQSVQLAVAFPPQLTPLKWRTQGPSRFTIRDGVVRFEPVPKLAAGGQLEYMIYVRADVAGPATVHAEANSTGQPKPIAAEVTTTVNSGF